MVRTLTTLLALAALAGCSQTATSGGSASYTAALASAGGSGGDVLKVCSGFGCAISETVSFKASDLEKLRLVMEPGKASAEAERAAVAKAVGVMETMSRAKGRYGRDNPKAWQVDSGKRGQMDCVDESLNTGAFLRYLHRHGLLRHHKPDRRYAERGLVVDGRYPHKSATMTDKTGIRWTVDSWYGSSGDPAEIMPHAKWRTVRNGFNG